MNRRTFLAASGLAGTALMASGKDTPGKPVVVLATDWGFKGNLTEFCEAIKQAGYDGMEMWWPGTAVRQKELQDALDRFDLKIGYLCGGSQTVFEEHFQAFRSALEAAAARKPLYINCHSGKDYFTYDQNKAFVDLTGEVAARTGIPVCHETHRGRMLYSAPVTRSFIEKHPSLRLTLDISHWCNVHESLLADQAETVDKALERVDHIHARIGHAQGPQVNDPRAPEWSRARDAHFAWWDKVVERKRKAGETVTFLTEFGPPDYFPTLPYTRQPVSDQWEINVYMMKLLRERYG